MQIADLKLFIKSLTTQELASLETYFYKFLPDLLKVKDECDLKYCVRSSGRFCIDCPNHPLRLNSSQNTNIIAKSTKLLTDKKYCEYILFLHANNLPIPDILEMQNILQKSIQT